MRANEDNLRFAVQFLFSAIVLLFCIYKLGTATDNQVQALYWGGITSILAWWMPSPGAQRNAAIQAGAVNIERLNDSSAEIPINHTKKLLR